MSEQTNRQTDTYAPLVEADEPDDRTQMQECVLRLAVKDIAAGMKNTG